MTTNESQAHPDLPWTKFYMEFANKLLKYKDKQGDLLDRFNKATEGRSFPGLDDVEEIDPFTVMATFNRGERTPDAKRTKIAVALREALDVNAEAPEKFKGIPTVDNRMSWFFDAKGDVRRDMGYMWDVFDAALELKSLDDATGFIEKFNRATQVGHVKRKLTFGLYWVRPDIFVALDKNNRRYVEKYGLASWPFGNSLPSGSGQVYVDLCAYLLERLKSPEFDVETFQELSWQAWLERDEPYRPLDDSGYQGIGRAADVVFRSKGLSDPRGTTQPEPIGQLADPAEPALVSPGRGREAEAWVEDQLRKEFGRKNVERYGYTNRAITRWPDGLYPGFDFLVKRRNSDTVAKFVEVKSAKGSLPSSVRLTAGEFLRAWKCSEQRIPYELWVVVFDGNSTLFRVIDHRILTHFEKEAAKLTIHDFASVGVQLRYPD